MGIAKAAAQILTREASRRAYSGRVLTLGKQDIYVSSETLLEIANLWSYRLSSVAAVPPSKAFHREKKHLSDRTFFETLGFADVHSIDVSDYEGASELFDLNLSSVPAHLLGQFDLIVDGGTIEHVFHLPNALNNIFRMLKTGGRVVHLAPSSNHIDHGFYMFSPTLFVDFYSVNRFELNCVQVFRYTPRHDTDPWEMIDYRPGCLDNVAFGGLDDSMYGIAVVATKTEESTGDRVPSQGAARALLGNAQSPAAPERQRRSLIQRVRNRIFPQRPAKGIGLPVKNRF